MKPLNFPIAFVLLLGLASLSVGAKSNNRPGIAGHFLEVPAQLDLSSEGTSDGLRFGRNGQPVLTRKPGANLIALEPPPTAAVRGLPGMGSRFTWNENVAHPATNDLGCTGDGNGFVVTAPADRRNRTLHLYVAAKRAWAELVASVSGGGVGWYADTTLRSTGSTTSRCYIMNYTPPRSCPWRGWTDTLTAQHEMGPYAPSSPAMLRLRQNEFGVLWARSTMNEAATAYWDFGSRRNPRRVTRWL